MSALLVQLARLDPPVPQAHRAALDLQALLDPQEQPVRKAKRERRAPPAQSVRPVKPAPKAPPVRKAPKV
ncbi:hypothetical protein [Methylobacterium sp. PvR107]|uniref:hypothetical protein n=1 Tax=Methylobacterium sp. PvR107 TaxID=2806597 RepID=UPI001B71F5F0|nr:hypothetical protein [Methylobacterium sp. PvR107]MBP1179975.1 hypothetical protein [Methylobacterium sp. PvR107]